MRTTERFGLQIPSKDDFYGIDHIAYNMEIIDANLNVDNSQSSTTDISDDGNLITTTFADGSKIVTEISDDATTILEKTYDKDNVLVKKWQTVIDESTIRESEVSISE